MVSESGSRIKMSVGAWGCRVGSDDDTDDGKEIAGSGEAVKWKRGRRKRRKKKSSRCIFRFDWDGPLQFISW